MGLPGVGSGGWDVFWIFGRVIRCGGICLWWGFVDMVVCVVFLVSGGCRGACWVLGFVGSLRLWVGWFAGVE